MDQIRNHKHKPGGVFNPSEAADRRRRESAAAAVDRKNAVLRSKRLRREASAASLGGMSREPSAVSLGGFPSGDEEGYIPMELPEDITQQMQAAVSAAKESAAPVGCSAHLTAVRALRQLLSNYEEPPYEAALASGAIPALISALQPPFLDSTSLETIFEAAWALTNLAVGRAEIVAAVIPAAPVLIAYLGGGSGPAVAEQCAWALGNIAAEDSQYREVLVANGVVQPLTGMFVQAAKKLTAVKNNNYDEEVRGGDKDEVAAGVTAAWALGNVLRGAGATEIGEFMSTEGAPEALISLIRPEMLPRASVYFTSEAAWILAYITAAPSEAHLNRLVHLGVVANLKAQIVQAAKEILQDEESGRTLLLPFLRALGNILGGGGKDALSQILTAPSDLLTAILTAAQQAHHALQREAAWVLSNIAGIQGKDGVELLKNQPGALPILMSLLQDQPFQVRKEAAYALTNVCAGGGGGTGDLEALNHLFGGNTNALRAMVSLMRSADVEAEKLGLQFTEMLLRVLPSGVAEVEAVDGIDALEQLQFGENVPHELREAAAEVVNRYWSVES